MRMSGVGVRRNAGLSAKVRGYHSNEPGGHVVTKIAWPAECVLTTIQTCPIRQARIVFPFLEDAIALHHVLPRDIPRFHLTRSILPIKVLNNHLRNTLSA